MSILYISLQIMFQSASRKLAFTINSKLSSYLLSKRARNSVCLVRDHYHRVTTKHKLFPKENPKGSKYCPPSRDEIAKEEILSFLNNKRNLSNEEWSDFKENLIDHKDYISEDTFGVMVMNALISSNQLELSHNFIEYLEQSPSKPNFLTYLKYMSLCSKNYRHVDQKLFFKLIDKVKVHIDSSPILDKKRAEYFIQGLCVTDKWKDSLKIFDKLIDSKPTREMYNSIALASIRNGEEDLAWEILTKWMNIHEAISDTAVEEFLLVALKKQKLSCKNSDAFLLKLFRYMQKRNIIVNLNVAKLIEHYFNSHRFKWKVAYTKVSRNKGTCATCETSLEPSSLKDEEFKFLCSSFLERAIKKSDLYINTTSREFKNYMEFINLHKPFHIVLDGLNAAYSFGGMPNKKALASQLLKIVHILSGNSRKLLVLGRKHMQYWPKYELIKISQKAQLFFADDISEDDPFVLYAALASGPHTYFLSDDLMRDHLSRLEDPKLIHLFKKWQLSRQVHLKCEGKDINFIEPVKHDIAVQGDFKNGWHIPFDDKIILDPYEELNNWLCIKRVE